MSIFKALQGAAAATALLVATTGAAAAAPAPTSIGNPAAPLSLSAPRAGTATHGNSRLGASVPTTTLISIGILAALIVIVLVATGGNDSPDSP